VIHSFTEGSQDICSIVKAIRIVKADRTVKAIRIVNAGRTVKAPWNKCLTHTVEFVGDHLPAGHKEFKQLQS